MTILWLPVVVQVRLAVAGPEVIVLGMDFLLLLEPNTPLLWVVEGPEQGLNQAQEITEQTPFFHQLLLPEGEEVLLSLLVLRLMAQMVVLAEAVVF